MTTPTSNTCPCTIVPDMVMSTIYHACPVHGIGPIPRNPENCTCTPSSLNVACPIHGPSICWRAERTPEPQTEPIPTPDLVSKGEGDVYQTEQSLDEAGDSRTWTERERKIYEIGHREGESCEGASWTLALDDLFGDSDEEITPSTVVDIIAREVAKAREDYATQLLKWVRYNKHDMGEMGEFIRVGYVENGIKMFKGESDAS